MKKNKLILLGLLSAIAGLGIVSCSCEETKDDPSDITTSELNGEISDLKDDDPLLKETKTLSETDFYSNDFSDEQIANQWPEYGIGDPFVYRWNGTYYLYVSTKDGNIGVRGYKSTDLVHYEPITGEGLPFGYVSNDEKTLSAYAPEVMYKNGTFYMILSPAGRGHILLKSDSPEGPFISYTDSLDANIDGSFFYGNDENVYLLKANSSGIVGNELNSEMSGFTENSNRFNNTSMGSWTEGPYLLNRDGIYYMTYTGTNVASPAYRVGYAVSTEENFYNPNAFTSEGNILLNTSDSYQGLGHSSTVLGPNMDSYYIAYHNLRSSGGPIRGYNIAKLNFNGTMMNVDHPELTNNINPELPSFSSYNGENLVAQDGFKLTSEATSDTFTAEYNVTGTGAKMIFSYQDKSNYSYATIDNNEINVKTVSNGEEKAILNKKLANTYDYSKLHTLRLSYKDGSFDVNFDSMLLVNDYEATFKGGKIGYNESNTFTIGFTGFSNYAEGSSENNHIYQDSINANSYSEEKSKLNGSGLKKVEATTSDSDIYQDNAIIDSYYMDLKEEGDRATYEMYFDKEGIKGFSLRVPRASLGKKIGVRVNDGDIIEYTIPNYSSNETAEFYVEIGNIKVKEGVNNISFYNVGDEVEFLKADFYDTSNIQTTYTNDLSAYIDTGATYVNTWKIKHGGHYALAGTRQLVYFGDETLGDVDVEVTLNFEGELITETAGIVVAGKNASFSIWDDSNSIQGYYCFVNNVDIGINETNYNNSTSYVASTYRDDGSLDSGKDIKLRVTKIGKEINFYVNDQFACSYISPLGNTRGYVGLYTDGAAVTYKNLTIKTL